MARYPLGRGSEAICKISRYDEVVGKLKQAGRIYACYDTPEELEFKRKRLLAKGLPPIYDRQALRYTAEDLSRFTAEGRKPHYRFKLESGEIVWHDVVRGICRYDADKLSDPVIIREDGSYLYHLPSVIDDVDFAITHIVRGEDHVTNTAAQIQMFQAVGGKIPTFAHLPLLTGKEGKLSKRLGSLGVRELREEGIEAMAICSFWPNSAHRKQSNRFIRLRSWPKRWTLKNRPCPAEV